MKTIVALIRAVGGALMTLGLFGAFLCALFTGWLSLATAWDVLQGKSTGVPIVVLAVGCGGVAAGIVVAVMGRLILGRRVEPSWPDGQRQHR